MYGKKQQEIRRNFESTEHRNEEYGNQYIEEILTAWED